NGIVTTVQTAMASLSVQVQSLQTQLSSTNQNDIAQALQNFSASLQSVTAQTAANTQSISQFVSPPAPGVVTTPVSYTTKPTDGTVFYTGVMDGSQGITLTTTNVALGATITVKVISTNVTGSALNINTFNSAE